MRKITFLLALLIALPASQRAQQAQQGQTQQTGSIEGSVVKFGTADAIPRVKVTLRPANSPNSQTVTADDGGKFAFRDLASGQYRITANRDGFVATEYGQRSPTGSGVPINLTAQQQFKDAKISMSPNGAIAGRVVNRYGEPVANANVTALRYTYQDGRRSLTQVQASQTNDLGEYRLFFMPPGQYVISAQAQNALAVDPGGTVMFQGVRGGGGPAGLAAAAGAQLGVGGVTSIMITAGNGPGGGGRGGIVPPPPPPGAVTDDSNLYLPVYYPGTTDVTGATPVDLRAGGTVGGVNLTAVDAKPMRIRGQVTSGGRPAAGAQVSIFQRNSVGGSLIIRNVPANSDTGAFEFRNMAPGAYELIATINAAGPGALVMGTPLGNAAGITTATLGPRGGGAPGGQVMAAHAQVDLNANDIDGVSLLLENGFNVSGRVSIEGRAATADAGLNSMRVQLQPDPVIPVLAVPAVNPDVDGSLSITGVTPGAYRLNVTGLPRNTYIKSARLGGVDVLNGGLRLDGEPRGPLDIVLGNGPASLDASVVDDRQLPVAAVTVALVPESSQQKRYDLYRSATSDSTGRIHLDGVVPGEYKVYAWESVENGAWTDPDFMRNYQSSGAAVRITESGRAAVDVKVIPYRVN